MTDPVPSDKIQQKLGEIVGEMAARNEAAQEFRREFRETNDTLVKRIDRGFEAVRNTLAEHAEGDRRQFDEIRTRTDQSDGAAQQRGIAHELSATSLKRIATWTAILGGALGVAVTGYQLYLYSGLASRAVMP